MLVFFFIQFFIHPYESAVANYLESFYLLVLVVLLGLGNTPVLLETVKFTLWPLFYLPIVVGLVVVAVCMGYIVWYVTRETIEEKSLRSSWDSNLDLSITS